MEKVVFLIFSRKNDSFNIIYVGDCEKTEKVDFFEKIPNFNSWGQIAGSKNSLYLAILPMFESNSLARKVVMKKIIGHYRPVCNPDSQEIKKPDYITRSKMDLESPNPTEKKSNEITDKTSCPCCGSEMKVDKILENTTILKCTGCGISDSRLNS